jgi:hypothetical protein
VQESLNLELWLKRYGVLKFQGYFMNFSETRDPSKIIFQIPGASLQKCQEILQRNSGASLQKLQRNSGASLHKCQEILNFGFSDLFRNGKVHGLGPHFVDHGLRPVHSGSAQWREQKTAGERPVRCSSMPVLASGCREGEGRCGGLATGLTRARGAAEWPGD